jgi:hypothetical protein
VDCLNQINAVLAANNIQDSSGNLIQFAASLGNIVWIIALAVGNMEANKDLNLLGAAQQFSIQQETTAQLLETLPMTGTQVIPGAFSLLTLQVAATSAGCTIPVGTKAPYGTMCNFVVENTTVIGPSGVANILCQSDTLGPIAVAAGAITAFSSTIAGVASVTNPAGAILGRLQETSQQLQQRLLAGNVIQTNLGGTIAALQGIQGLTSAVVYLNVSPATTLVLAGATVPSLSSYIVVEGSDITGVAIANAYSTRMLTQTFSLGGGMPALFSYGPRTDYTFLAGDNSVNTAAGNFLTAGFVAGQWVTISGSVSNNVNGLISTVTALKMVLTNVVVTAEADANSITLSASALPPVYTRTDISFSATDNSINTVAGVFNKAGFVAGQWIQITDGAGSPLNNGVIGNIVSATAAKIILSNCSIATEASGGASMSLTVKNVQPYTTASKQLIPIQYDVAPFQQIYVTVYYDINSVSAVNFTGSIAAILTAMSWTVGQPVTSALIAEALFNFPYCRITGAQVSLVAGGGGLANEVLPNVNAMPQILAANVSVVPG